MQRLSKPTFAALVAAALGACTVNVEGDVIDDGSGTSVVSNSRSRRPADDSNLIDVSVEPDALTLRYNGDAPDFAAGDVLVGSEGPGYLRKVTGVEDRGDSVRLTTVNADIGDAFDRVDVAVDDVPVTPDQPIVVPASDETHQLVADDGTVYTAHVSYEQGQSDARSASVNFAWEFPGLSIELTDPSGNVTFSLSAENVRVEKTLGLDFASHWAFFKLNDLRFIVDDDTVYSVEKFKVTVRGQLPKFSQSIPLIESPVLATIPIGPLVFTVGGGLRIGVDALISGTAGLETTSSVSLSTHSRRGVTWDGSIHPVDESGADVDADVGSIQVGQAQVSLDASFFIAGHLNFALYGVVGPDLHAKIAPVAAHLSAGINGWDLSLGAKASAGLSFGLPAFHIDAVNIDFLDWSQQYYQTSGTF